MNVSPLSKYLTRQSELYYEGLVASTNKYVVEVRAALHLEAGRIPPEADWMNFQPLLGWRPVSTIHYNKI